jgi:hypothetical protein
MALPININDLLNGKPVEWERLEFKADGAKSGPSRVQAEILPGPDLKPMLADGLLEMTIPYTPPSSKQCYRTTKIGWNLVASLKEGGA